MAQRVFILVLDGVGAGELPDAAAYGDEGSNTLGNTALAVGGLKLPNMQSFGLGNLMLVSGVEPASRPLASYGRLRERSPGKDSVTGHWEMMGIVLKTPFPTYPNGFPNEVIRQFAELAGCEPLANRPASGTEIIRELGDEHVRSGRPIVYTSADSVFQIAAHEEVMPVEQLYALCRAMRAKLTGEHAVGRVIARPFAGQSGHYRRTEWRMDFPLEPPRNYLDELAESGRTVHAIGKIWEFFGGRSIAAHDATTNNRDHMAALLHAVRSGGNSLIFANLEDFDMLYGHRNDPAGFARALSEFDDWLAGFVSCLRRDDLLILTSDHGNDPTTPSTDHSREHAFVLVYDPTNPNGINLGVRDSFAFVGETAMNALAPESGFPPARE